MTRYEAIAKLMADEIRSGSIGVGSRMPSLRQIMSQQRVSQATASRAYHLLEKWGLVRAEERSGYYVARGAGSDVRLQHRPAPLDDTSRQLDIDELVFSVLDATKHPDIVPLGSAFASPMLFPLQRLARSLAQSTRLTDPWHTVIDLPPGSERLRMQIARRYIGIGIARHIDEIIVTDGGLEALNLCLAAVTRPGDLVAVETPGFYGALQAIERFDLRAIEIPVHPLTGLDLEALSNALENQPIRACWFMTNFQNPTGVTMSIEKKKALVELLEKHQVPLIEDDVYGELHFDREYPPPALAFDSSGLVMHCSSFSKTLAPGYRVGWATAGRFADRVRKLKLMSTLSAGIPVQAGIADYLENGAYDRHLRKLRAALHTQLDGMAESIRRWLPRDVKVTRPIGGYFVWLEFPKAIDAMRLHQLAIRHGFSLAPGPIFSSMHAFDNCIRLNFGHPWDRRCDHAIRTLGELLEHPGVVSQRRR
jgi:DNA-binding transcriptional MocR family regulator